MIRLRRQHKLSTMMAVVLALGVNFAWAPWPGSGFFAVALVIPLLFTGFTRIEWLVIYSIIGLLGILMLPAVGTNHQRGRARPVITAPPPITVPQGARIAVPSPVGHESDLR
jgi:hypothetical protein